MKRFSFFKKRNREKKSVRGKLVVYSGPSGVGKGTLREYFINDPKYKLVFSVSNTTRTMRATEKNGVDYNFVTKSEFENLISKGKMLEYVEYANNYYGTPLTPVIQELEQGNNVFLEIESVGVEQVIKKFPKALTFFILPPSIEELLNRLKNRATEDDLTRETRIKIAQTEIEKSKSDIFKYKIVNEDIKKSVTKIRNILDSELT